MNVSDFRTDSLMLQTISNYLSLVLNFVTLLLGTIGGACNLITFTSPRLRQSASAFYLMGMTIFQIVSIVFIVPTRMALDNFHNDFENRSVIFCKIRYYLVLTLPELATFYLLLTFIDRYVATSTNAWMRSWSQLRVARRLSHVVLTAGPVRNIHVLVFLGIYNGKCQVNPTGAYIIFLTIYLLLVVIALPYTLMFVLAVMTVINTRRSQQRVLPASRLAPQRRLHRFECQIFSVGHHASVLNAETSSPPVLLVSVHTSRSLSYKSSSRLSFFSCAWDRTCTRF